MKPLIAFSVAFMVAVSLLAISKAMEQGDVIQFQSDSVTDGRVFPITTFSYCQGQYGNDPGENPTYISGFHSGNPEKNDKVNIRNLPSGSYGYAVQNVNVEDPTDITDRECKVNGKSGGWVAALSSTLSFEGCPCLGMIGLGVPDFYVPGD